MFGFYRKEKKKVTKTCNLHPISFSLFQNDSQQWFQVNKRNSNEHCLFVVSGELRFTPGLFSVTTNIIYNSVLNFKVFCLFVCLSFYLIHFLLLFQEAPFELGSHLTLEKKEIKLWLIDKTL